MFRRALIALAMFSCIVNCMEEFDTAFSSESLLTWSCQVLSRLTYPFSYTVSVINNSPWQLDFPKTLHASGGVVSMPSGLKSTDKDTFVSMGATSTEGLLSFPVNGDSRSLTIYWKVPEANSSQDNMIGVYFGSLSVDDTLLQKMRNGTLPGFQAVRSKDTWFTYFLDQQVSVQVMMSDQSAALSAVHISYGYDSIAVSGANYKIQTVYKGLNMRVEWVTRLQQYGDTTYQGQQWTITKIENNFYKLVNVLHGCALTIVNQFDLGCIAYNSNNINQAWEIIRLNTKDYKIKGASSTMCLDSNLGETNASPMILWECYDNDLQIFRMIKL